MDRVPDYINNLDAANDNVNGWREHLSDEDTLDRRIALHQREVDEAKRNNPNRPPTPPSPPSPFELRLREAARQDQTDAAERQAKRPQQQGGPVLRPHKPREPFWRAKERDRFRDTPLVEPEAEKSDVVRPKQHLRSVSEGQNLSAAPSDPPVNVPEEWGRRNRRRADWLLRKTEQAESLGLVDSAKRIDDDTVLFHKTLYTGDDNLVSGEENPRSARRRRQFSSPSSLHNMNTTLQSTAQDVDDLDFNDASILVSTPAPNNRNRKIDALMKEDEEQKVVEVQQRGVTTQRQSRFAGRGERADRPVSAPDGENKPFPRRRRSIKDKEPTTEQDDDEPRELPTVAFKDTNRMELLRTLARASSLSPSPAPDKVVREYSKQRRKSDEQARVEGVKTTEDKDKDNWDASEVPTLRQRVKGKKTAITSVFSTKQEEQAEPNPILRGPISRLTERDPRRINSEPSQPKSALEAIVQEAKATHDPNFGDSTIASLEDIAHPNVDNSTLQPEEAEKVPAKREEEDIATAPLEENRRREEREIEEVNRRLRVARTSIKDAYGGLTRLGNRLESTETEPTTNLEREVAEEATEPTRRTFLPDHPSDFRPYTDHNGRTKCRHCGGCYTSVWRGLWVEFRELFYTWDTLRDGSPLKLTWLGTIVAAWWGWFLAEMIVAKLFEPWLYGARFPFVTTTLLWRVLSEPLQTAKWLVDVGGNFVFGDSSTVTSTTSSWARKSEPTRNEGDWVAAAAAATSAATRRVVGSVVEGLDEAGSMWDDDYLKL